MNKDSVLTLAQKEFSDKIYEPSFILLMNISIGTVFIYLQNRAGGNNFWDIVQVIAVFSINGNSAWV